MRKCKGAALRQIPLSDIESLKEAGYVPLEHGDASKANSDYFVVMVKDKPDGGRDVEIVCPSFLHGPLGLQITGGISY